MKLGLIQTVQNGMYNFLQDGFPYSSQACVEMQGAMVAQNINLLRRAENKGYDLLVTTECTNYIRTSRQNAAENAQYYPTLDSPQIAQYARCAKAAGSWLVAGMGYRNTQGAVYNAALVFDRAGQLCHIYHKTHLVGDEPAIFARGDTLLTVQADFGCFGVCVCWDLQFPELARALALQGADLIVCPTWGYEENLYGRARAYENGVFVGAAMAVPLEGCIVGERSPSSIVGPDGTVRATAPRNEATLLTHTFELSESAPFKALHLGDRQPQLYQTLTHKEC